MGPFFMGNIAINVLIYRAAWFETEQIRIFRACRVIRLYNGAISL